MFPKSEALLFEPEEFDGRITSQTVNMPASEIEPATRLQLEQITNRSILKIEGNLVNKFLQRIITNDLARMSQLGALYVMFPNRKGRIITDGIIYKSSDPNTYLVDIDSNTIPFMLKHLQDHVYHHDISIRNLETQLNVWQIFNPEHTSKETHILANNRAISMGSSAELEDVLVLYQDPRHQNLGTRLITSTDIGQHEIRQRLDFKPVEFTTWYKEIRYKLGIPEGIREIPPAELFPLELNGDYMEALHFNKGQYIGSEVMIKRYLLNFTRFRIVPIVFPSQPKSVRINDLIIATGAGKKPAVGNVRGIFGNFGLALIYTEAIQRNDLTVQGFQVEARKPDWWPCLLPNELPFL